MLVVFTKNDFSVGTTEYNRIESLTKNAYDLAIRVPFALSYVDGVLEVIKNRDPEFKPAKDLLGLIKQIDQAEKHNEYTGFGIY